MFSLYIQPAANFLPSKRDSLGSATDVETPEDEMAQNSPNHRDPVAFLYYSIVLTVLTVIVAIVIGVIQLLTMILNVTSAKGKFWDGVQVAGDYYDAIGGGICGCFIVFGGLSVLLYKPWRRWMDRVHGRSGMPDRENDGNDTPGFTDDNETVAREENQSGLPGSESQIFVGKATTSRVTAMSDRRIEDEIV